MKRMILALAATLALPPAHAIGRLADVTVTDRGSGAPLALYYARGSYWVAGSPGARYAIAIVNHTGERLLAVTAVDGVNVVSGETAAVGQTGYVFAAHERYEIAGWRKSDREVAAFEFTASPDSYAERTGRPANVGIIGVALFTERAPLPSIADARTLAPRAENAPAAAAAGLDVAGAPSPGARMQSAVPAEPRLGTGHGEREASLVSHTDFERQRAQPDELIRIRYDSYEHLLAMGIIRAPRVLAPNPFPGGGPYVADPPR
jgi:hypothetical protein